jgi:hypothetical protein
MLKLPAASPSNASGNQITVSGFLPCLDYGIELLTTAV